MLRLQETPLSASPIGRSISSSPPCSRGARSQSNFYWKQIRQRKEIRAGQQPGHPACCPSSTCKGQMSVQGGDTGTPSEWYLQPLWMVDGRSVGSPSSSVLWDSGVIPGPKYSGEIGVTHSPSFLGVHTQNRPFTIIYRERVQVQAGLRGLLRRSVLHPCARRSVRVFIPFLPKSSSATSHLFS